jgi:N-methylhydantoinase B
MSRVGMDPVTLEVFHESLVATVAEMRVTVARTAFSSIIYEGLDFSCALLDAAGRFVAQSLDDAPVHILPLPLQAQAALRYFNGDIAPGDILLTNDPYMSGTHLNDVAILCPFFVDGEMFFINCVRAHWGDIGGMTPGSISGRTTEIFQEGVRIPPIKIYDQGRPNQAVLDLLFANVRQPRDRRGDFHAALAASKTAEERLQAIISRFGVTAVRNGIEQILDRTESRMRAMIAKLAEGEYLHEDYLDTDGNTPDPVRIRVRVRVLGSDVAVDLAGSSPQRPGPVNTSLAVTSTGVFVTLKALLDPGGHINDGAFRPIHIIAPEGTVVNATYPAPMGGFVEIYRRVSGTLLGALSKAVPTLVAGDTKGSANHVYIACLGDREVRTIFYEYPAGGTGGFLEADGSNAVREWDTGDFNSIQSAEFIEHQNPLRIERCEVRPDSGGPGRRRGGLGMRREILLEGTRGLMSVLSERNIFPPYGVNGADSAAPNRFYVIRDSLSVEPSPMPGKVSGFPLEPGDRVVVLTAGGGGYGDPLERDSDAVFADITEGYVTEEQARMRYGVVIRKRTVDVGATKELRAEMLSRRPRMVARAWSPAGESADAVQTFWVHPQTAAELDLRNGDLVEVATHEGAPIRGRVSPEHGLAPGEIGMQEFSLRMLSVESGATLMIRALPSSLAT